MATAQRTGDCVLLPLLLSHFVLSFNLLLLFLLSLRSLRSPLSLLFLLLLSLGRPSAGRCQEFLGEVATVAKLAHPNLLRFVGAAFDGGLLVVTELCARGSLAALLESASTAAAAAAADGPSHSEGEEDGRPLPPQAYAGLRCVVVWGNDSG